MTDEAVEHGMLSAHYESMRSAHDQLLAYPMIPSDTITGSRLRVFIPHRPQRDNPRAGCQCGGGVPVAAVAGAVGWRAGRPARVHADGTP
ncbi:hypothetical protein G6F22_021458 [Rhizopus arrhizus]|nr:hypothetical protein G6F22_021458 [Rhizopus arrhizus]